MKRVASLLAMFYFMSAVGYGIELHYCLGQITDVNIAWLDTTCGCHGEHDVLLKKCCDEKEFFVQIEDEHQASSSSDQLDGYKSILAEISQDQIEAFATQQEELPTNNGPPIVQDLYKLNCAYITYG